MTNRKNKVLIIQPALPKYRVSLFNELNKLISNTSLMILAPRIDENGVESTTDGAEFEHTITSPSIHKLGFSWQPKVANYILNLRKGDILVISGNPRYIFNILLSFAVRIIGVKVIWWGQAWSAQTTKQSLNIKLTLMNLCNLTLLYTEKEARLVYRLTKSSNIHYLNNGINRKEIIELREDYNAYKREGRILFLGRLTEKSQFPLLLSALSKTDNVVLDVIGGKPNAQQLAILKQLNLCERVTFHGMITDEVVISNIVNKCLFFVYPGAVGLSIIHAFNYGLPALIHGNKKNHMPESSSFKELSNGLSFTQNNVESLSEKITLMARSHDLLNELSLNAIDVSRHNYNTESMAKNFKRALDSLAN